MVGFNTLNQQFPRTPLCLVIHYLCPELPPPHFIPSLVSRFHPCVWCPLGGTVTATGAVREQLKVQTTVCPLPGAIPAPNLEPLSKAWPPVSPEI